MFILKLGIASIILLVTVSINSYGQDSTKVYCYTLSEARQIALRLDELKQCNELMTITNDQLLNCRSMVLSHERIDAYRLGEIQIKDNIIELQNTDQKALLNRIRILKLKNTSIIVTAGAVIAGMGYLMIK